MLTINEMRGAMRHPIFGSPFYILMRDILIAMAECEQEIFDYVSDGGLVFETDYAIGNELDEVESSSKLLDVIRPPRAKALPLLDRLDVDGKPCPSLPPLPWSK